MKVIYKGPYPKVKVLGIGEFIKDKETSVTPEDSVKLLRIEGFKKKPEKPTFVEKTGAKSEVKK